MSQQNLLCLYCRLAHVDFEKIKDFARKGCLLKDIANYETPLCPYYIQSKQVRKSISNAATSGFIKPGDLKPSDKVSCDHCMS